MRRTGIEPCQQLGRLRCYHYTNDAEKVYDRKNDFQKFQTLILPYKFSECHIKKKPKLLFEKRSCFFACQTNLFLINRKLLFLIFVTSRGHWEVKKRQKFTTLWMFCPSNAQNSIVQSFPESKYYLPVVWVYALYRNWTHVYNLEGCVASSTPTMLRRYTFEEMTSRSFKHWFSLLHFLSVTSRKNQNYCLRSGVVFSLARLICFSLIESCCFWFVTSRGHWEVKNDRNLLLYECFVPLTHKIVLFNLSLKANTIYRSSEFMRHTGIEPCQQLGRLSCYHYTNDTEKSYDRRDDFQNFQTLFFFLQIFWMSRQEKTKTIVWEAE